jgi:hypothetical protein
MRIVALNDLAVLFVGIELVTRVTVALSVGVSGSMLEWASNLNALLSKSFIDLESSLANTMSLSISLSVKIITVAGNTQVVRGLVSGESGFASANSLTISFGILLIASNLLAELSFFVNLETLNTLAFSGLIPLGVFIGACLWDTRSGALVLLESGDANTISIVVSLGIGVSALDWLANLRVFVELEVELADAITVVISGSVEIIASGLLADFRVGVEFVVGDTITLTSCKVSNSVGVRALNLLAKLKLLVHEKSVLALALSGLKVSNGILVVASEVSAGGLVIHEVSKSGLANTLSIKESGIILADLANLVSTVNAVFGTVTIDIDSERSDTPGFAAGIFEVIKDFNLH